MKTDSLMETAGRKMKIALKTGLGLRGTKRVKILAGPARGVVMYLDFSGQTPMYLGMYEWELHRFLRTVLGDTRLIFDVGGSIGYDALLFAANSSGRVFTFEPDPVRARKLEENMACNPDLKGKLEIAEVTIAKDECPGVTSLDAFSESVADPDLIKIDIDGGELQALRGAIRLLRRRRPHLVVETHSLELERECGALLVECGYRPVIKHNRRVWREHRGGIPHNRWLLAAGLSYPND